MHATARSSIYNMVLRGCGGCGVACRHGGVGSKWESNWERDLHRPPNSTPFSYGLVRTLAYACALLFSPMFMLSPSPFATRHHPCSLHHPANSMFRLNPRPCNQSNPMLSPARMPGQTRRTGTCGQTSVPGAAQYLPNCRPSSFV